MVRAKRPFAAMREPLGGARRRDSMRSVEGGPCESGNGNRASAILPGLNVAANQFERLVGEHRRQAVRVAQLPAVDEAVVTRGAFQIHAEEDLSAVLRRLHGRNLAGADHAAPGHADEEAFRAAFGRGLSSARTMRRTGMFAPAHSAASGDGLAVAMVDDAFVIAKQIVPEADPVFGIAVAVSQQSRRQGGPFVGLCIRQERVEFRR